MTANLNADLHVSGRARERLDIAGTVHLNRTLIGIPNSLPPNVAVLDVRRHGKAAPPPPDKQLVVGLDVTLQAPQEFLVQGRGLDAEMGGELRLRGTTDSPLVNGGFDLQRGSFQVSAQRWVGGNNDPDIFESVFSSKKIPPNGSNRGHYRNPKLDALLDEARMEMDREKRKALLWEIQGIVAEDEPYINLWYPDNVCVHRERLTNIVIPPAGDYDFIEGARLR